MGCYILGNNVVAFPGSCGLLTDGNAGVYFRANDVATIGIGVMASTISHVFSLNNVDSGTMPVYGYKANNGGTISITDPHIDGSTADYDPTATNTAGTGGQVRT
jgi:hypothetical protein